MDAGTRIGPYEVVGSLGAGGMGEVYRATDTNLKRQVAIKVLPQALALDEDRLTRFRREAEVLAALNHPNIAAIYGLEQADGLSALIMELVEGPTLAERIAGGALPLDEAVFIARQIASALEAAHERGIVHRDLKPANIKVRSDGTVKLLDFGLAKAAEGQRGDDTSTLAASMSPTVASPAHLTSVGMILGTAAYMAPEQARGKTIDHRSDIWAFGVVLAEMVSGRRLFEGETVSDTIAAVLTREPDLDGVPPSLRRLIRLCLVKDPRARLRHIGDTLAVVDESVAEPAPAGAPQLWSWRHAAILASSVALTTAIAWWALRPAAVAEEGASFYLHAPPGAAFNYTYTATAISPDGRYIVFRVATANEAPALWLRPLNALDGRRIAGTDGADFPFWSPDSKSIGFFSTGKLKRVDINGSSPIVITDAPDTDTWTTGGAWNADGVILFGAPEGMYRVNASGGTAQLFGPVQTGETGYGYPQFLPDGDRFLMHVRSEDRTQVGLYVSSMSRPAEKRRLLETRRKAVFVANESGASGYLLYLQERTLLARRINRKTLALAGDPVVVAAGIAAFPPGFHASFWSSASGNLLAYRTESSDKPRLTWIHPDGKRQSDTGAEDFYTHVRVAADGSRAAMELADGTGNMDVWTWDPLRAVKTRVTFDPKPDRAPAFSPDGRELVFSSMRSGVWQLYRKDLASGRPEEQLTTGPGDKIVPTWSHDGRYILFIYIGVATAEDIWALPLDGGATPFPILQTTAVETNPALSPDGQWLAFESSQSGRPEVIVTPFPSSRRPVDASAPRWQVSTQGGSRPRWSGDGRSLTYVALDDGSLMRAAVRTTPAGLESEPPRVLAQIPVMPVARSPFDVAADGRVLLLERTVNSAALSVVTNWRRAMTAAP
jgi:Tol biopolymer transport system component/tRNA A-37 threonylcarbamoyl transferase component Bud32